MVSAGAGKVGVQGDLQFSQDMEHLSTRIWDRLLKKAETEVSEITINLDVHHRKLRSCFHGGGMGQQCYLSLHPGSTRNGGQAGEEKSVHSSRHRLPF